jgi:hypothetical protein
MKLQNHATVQRRMANDTQARLAEAMTRQDGATQQTARHIVGSTRWGAPGAAHTIITLHRHLMP